jgi:hypothetical protein
MNALLSSGAHGAVRARSSAKDSRRWLVLGVSVLLAACAAKPVTETSATGATTARPLTASDVDIVCRDVVVTGSHFPKRVCRSKREWGQIEDSSRSFTQGLQSSSTKNLAPAMLPNGTVNPTPIGGSPVY